MNEILIYLIPLLFISPTYVTNSSPLFLSSILEKMHPLDFGKLFLDKKRILGDGKTIEGTFFGFFMGLIYFLIFYYLDKNYNILNLYESIFEGFLLIIGAITGDIVGSFIKRRLGIERGEMLPVFDQIGFLVFALVFYSLIRQLSMNFITYVCFVTFLAHILTNSLSYSMKIKEKPF